MRAYAVPYNKYYKYGTENINTVVGSPTINNGVVSGFSTGSYLIANIASAYNAGTVDDFEIQFKISMPASITTNGRIINWYGGADSQNGPYLEVTSSGIALNFYNGTYYSCPAVQGACFNSPYWVRFIYDGTCIKGYFKTKKHDEWIENATINVDRSVIRFNRSDFAIGVRPHDLAAVYVWNGSVDLKESFININGYRRWSGTNAIECTEEEAVTTEHYIDCRIVEKPETIERYKFGTKPNAHIIGTPVIHDGVLSNITTNNYLQGSGIRGTSPWEVGTKYTFGSDVANHQYFLGSLDSNPSFLFCTESGYIRIYLSSNNSSWTIASAGYNVPAVANATQWLKTGWTGTEYYIDLSSDGETYERVWSVANTTPIYCMGCMYIGNVWNRAYPFRGTIDLKETYIKENGLEVWRAVQLEKVTGPHYDFTQTRRHFEAF